jgi:pimeloyl-ACP methyl ester carboxylesterase
MASFDSSGVEISYVVEGRGPPIVLVHGFASNLQGNWRATGVIEGLMNAGRQAVALDCRGHGRSAKPHDPQAYKGTAMADDVIALMDHLGLAQADLMGYSMGALIASSLLVRKPERFQLCSSALPP